MKIKKCTSCDGSGLEQPPIFSKDERKPNEKCYSCKGTGFDNRYTDNLVCPYCGNEEDSWEMHNEDSKYQCGNCEKYFAFETEHTRTFTSRRVDCLNGSDHEWGKPWDSGDKLWYRCKHCDESKREQKVALNEP